jgi:hypothetical protein
MDQLSLRARLANLPRLTLTTNEGEHNAPLLFLSVIGANCDAKKRDFSESANCAGKLLRRYKMSQYDALPGSSRHRRNDDGCTALTVSCRTSRRNTNAKH